MEPHFITDCQIIKREMVREENSNIAGDCLFSCCVFPNSFQTYLLTRDTGFFFYCILFTSIIALKFNWTAFSPCTPYSLAPHALPSFLQKWKKKGEDFFEVASAPTRVYTLSCYQKITFSTTVDVVKYVNHNSEGFQTYLCSLKLGLIWLIDDTSRVYANNPDI